jgi:hypothetical protein
METCMARICCKLFSTMARARTVERLLSVIRTLLGCMPLPQVTVCTRITPPGKWITRLCAETGMARPLTQMLTTEVPTGCRAGWAVPVAAGASVATAEPKMVTVAKASIFLRLVEQFDCSDFMVFLLTSINTDHRQKMSENPVTTL